MRVLIIGCGYVGSIVGKQLAAKGHSVTGVIRTEKLSPLLSSLGIQPEIADCSTLKGAGKVCGKRAEIVLFSVSSKGGDYRKIYFEGLRSVLQAIKKNPPRLFIYTSSASVYAQTHGEWITEDSPAKPPHENGRVLLETEQLLAHSAHEKFSSCILRISGIYGPGRHRLLDQLREGAQTLPGTGETWMNQVHRDDVAGAILHLIQLHASASHRMSEHRIFNVTDDTPVLQRDYVDWCCRQLERPAPTFDPTVSPAGARGRDFRPNRRISNRALHKTGWMPHYPSFKEGLKLEMEEEGE